jgi:hypothetical protein
VVLYFYEEPLVPVFKIFMVKVLISNEFFKKNLWDPVQFWVHNLWVVLDLVLL